MALTKIPGSGINANSVTPVVLTAIQSSFDTINSTLTVPNISASNVRTDNLLHANGSAYTFTTPAAGSDTQVQFNSANIFAGSANLIFNTTTNTLSATNFVGNGAGLSSITGANVLGQVANATHALTATVADTANAVAGANVSGTVANATYAVTSGTTGTVTTTAQPNITSVGTLTSLSVTGNTAFSGANVSLGSVSNIKITGGTANFVLQTDGAGTLSWVAAGASSSSTTISEKINKTITNQIGYAITSALAIVITLPSTIGFDYIIHSIYITNIDPLAAATTTVTGNMGFVAGPATIVFANKIPVPARGV